MAIIIYNTAFIVVASTHDPPLYQSFKIHVGNVGNYFQLQAEDPQGVYPAVLSGGKQLQHDRARDKLDIPLVIASIGWLVSTLLCQGNRLTYKDQRYFYMQRSSETITNFRKRQKSKENHCLTWLFILTSYLCWICISNHTSHSAWGGILGRDHASESQRE